ncbi:hypothetical protein N7530_010129 [Penicillium desertorum]|uniref:Uncharacterized protein n=1 Tax=Penicillium desertorum TaxID=1303715 RepID=A0A9W9WKD4_9EURO|nr:hypothetical protein N7530_010129 [Penicillium desertorum]
MLEVVDCSTASLAYFLSLGKEGRKWVAGGTKTNASRGQRHESQPHPKFAILQNHSSEYQLVVAHPQTQRFL